ncbi:hypothetical protein [Methylovulum sp.]|uniref:hypothetical protein n=1 Tax=Methylovulum sp. TaxID=1916980 RepID=UPI0026373305|nr:hypothetical protein [Methylovulum sp.]MDD5124984.1 hypothetical protein [Methylovulum sp.]
MKAKRDEVGSQRDKAHLKTLKQQDDDGELMPYYFDESGFSTAPCVPYGWQRISTNGCRLMPIKVTANWQSGDWKSSETSVKNSK